MESRQDWKDFKNQNFRGRNLSNSTKQECVYRGGGSEVRADCNPLSAAELGARPAGILSGCPGPRTSRYRSPSRPKTLGSPHTFFPLTTAGSLLSSSFLTLQVGVTVLEAQKLVGVNNNPSVAVRVGEQRRVTTTQRGTNCPFYKEVGATREGGA